MSNIILSPPDMLGAYEAVSASKAWRIAQTLQYAIDQQPQCFVSWAGLASGYNSSHLIVPQDNYGITWAHPYRHTWNYANKPCNIKLLVYARASTIGTATITLRARVVPDLLAVGNMQFPALLDVSATVSSSSATLAIDEFVALGDGSPYQSSWCAFAVVENSQIVGVSASMMRLELTLSSDLFDSESSTAEIVGVSLWGFT